jgi:hypothetical protein
MRRAVEAQAGRLLRVLLLRLGAMSAGSSSRMLSMTVTLHTPAGGLLSVCRAACNHRAVWSPVEAADHSKYVTLSQNSDSLRP